MPACARCSAPTLSLRARVRLPAPSVAPQPAAGANTASLEPAFQSAYGPKRRVLSLTLDSAEIDRVVLDPNEYLDSQWLRPDEILDGNFHPALKFAVSSLLSVRKLRQLQACAGLRLGSFSRAAVL